MEKKSLNKHNSRGLIQNKFKILLVFSLIIFIGFVVGSILAETHISSATIIPEWSPASTLIEHTVTVENIEGEPIEEVRIIIPTNTSGNYSDLGCGNPPLDWSLSESTFVECTYVTTTAFITQGDDEEFTLEARTGEENGGYTWHVRTGDNSNSTVQYYHTYPVTYVDTIAPEFTIEIPEDGSWVNDEPFNVETSEIVEEGSGITAEECDVYYRDISDTLHDLGPIDYDDQTHICSGEVNIPGGAAQGMGSLIVRIEDDVENLGEGSIDLGFDITPPLLDSAETTTVTTIDVVFNEDILESSIQTTDFLVEDNVVSGVAVLGDTVTLTLSNNLGTADEPMIWIVDDVSDLAGNTISSGSIMAEDGIPPFMESAITGNSLTGNSIETNKIIIQFSEDLRGNSVQATDFSVDGHVVINAQELNGFVLLTLSDNLETYETPEINIIGNGVTDMNGNRAESGNIIPDDGLIPTMDLARLTSDYTIDVYFSEDLDGTTVQTSDFIVVGASVMTKSVSENVVTLNLDSAVAIGVGITLVNGVEDLFGNVLEEAGPIYAIDGVPPYIEELTIDPESPVPEGIVTFTIYFNERMNPGVQPVVTFGLVEPYNQNIVEGTWLSVTDIYIWQGTFEVSTSTGDGLNTISVLGAEDEAGNMMEIDTSNTFTIDTTPPLFISVISPDPDTVYTDGETITIIADLGEIGLEVVGDFINTGGGEVEGVDNGDGTYTLTYVVVAGIEGTWAIPITATDLAGNSAEYNLFEVTIDNTPPQVTEITGDTTAQAGQPKEICATVIDEFSDVEAVTLYYTPIGSLEESLPMVEGASNEWCVDVPGGSSLGEIPYYLIADDVVPHSIREPLEGNYIITVGPGPVDPALSTVVADPTEMIEANGIDESTVTVTLVDEFGHPIPGETVYLESNREEDTITPETEITDEDGIAIFYVSSTLGGTSIITAYVEEVELQLEQTATIIFEDLIIDFESGWTVFSVPTYLTEEEITELFPGEIDEVLMYEPLSGYTVPTIIEPLVGYYVHNSDEEMVQVAFDWNFSEIPTPLWRDLTEGWNIMGVTPNDGYEILANDALYELLNPVQIVSRLTNPYTGVNYLANPYFQEDLTLYLGEGHWIYLMDDGTLVGWFYQ